MDKWIKCSDQMPPEGQWVLVVIHHDEITLGMFEHNINGEPRFRHEDFGAFSRPKDVTHWMPLPALPVSDV